MRSIPADSIILIGCGSLYNIGRRPRTTTAFPCNRRRNIALLPARPVHTLTFHVASCLRRAQDGRLPLHIAAMQQGGEAEAVVALLLEAYPAGAKEKDNVRCRNPDLPSVCGLTHRSYIAPLEWLLRLSYAAFLARPIIAHIPLPIAGQEASPGSGPAMRKLWRSAPHFAGAGFGRLVR